MENEDKLNPDMNRVDPSEDIGGVSRNEQQGDEEEVEDAGENMQ